MLNVKDSKEIKGMIFDIEEFAIYDGPGIRTAVFFKGCPLRCIWCHNPEGLAKNPELTIKNTLCDHCGRCEAVCEHAFNRKLCSACGHCIDECPKHIRKISGYEITAGELAEKLKKNTDFYKESGGGVTISGGEPFYQSEFLLALLGELNTIHRAIETSGYTSIDIFTESLDYVDLYIMDIKHTDSEIHKEITGADNRQILENLEILKKSGKPYIIRIPLIPGINDGDENLRNTAELLKSSENLVKVELLPYNKFTKTKYISL
ncbi:MAG: glycyl-radical enzyme activating protein, partial [Oscillospiraceae bacterium]|nr:glycyl-radical enzyme activating protein [Oscillospiraceae bacterium]